MPPHKRSKITLLNSWRTDDSLPVSTLVTPDSYCHSDNSKVQVRVLKSFVCSLSLFNNRQYSEDRVHRTQRHRTAGLKSAEILL